MFADQAVIRVAAAAAANLTLHKTLRPPRLPTLQHRTTRQVSGEFYTEHGAAIPLHIQAHDILTAVLQPSSPKLARHCPHSPQRGRPSCRHVVCASAQHIAQAFLSTRLASSGTRCRAGSRQTPRRCSVLSQGSAALRHWGHSVQPLQICDLSPTCRLAGQPGSSQTWRTAAADNSDGLCARSARSGTVLPQGILGHAQR